MELLETGPGTALLCADTSKIFWIPHTKDIDLHIQSFVKTLPLPLLFKIHEHRDFVLFSLLIAPYCTPSPYNHARHKQGTTGGRSDEMNLEESNKDVKVLKATLTIGRNRDTLSVKEKAWVICDDYLKTLKDSLEEKESSIIFQAPEDKFKFKR